MQNLIVKGRYLAHEDGTPFFCLADTAWELFHRLNREEIDHYMATRASQGFTAAQCVALAEFEGLTVPNAYGRLPLLTTGGMPDPLKPDLAGDYSYWDHVDYAVRTAAKHGLYIVLLPTWGDKFNLCWGKGPVVFDETNARAYGEWIASRYKDDGNIIWMLGGDRPLEAAHRKVIDEMAAGIRAVDSHHLITFHPPGANQSTAFVGDAPYIDFHTAQTGHGIEHCYQSDAIMVKMAGLTDKPYMDSEPRYEDHPACFNDTLGYLWNADDVRQNAYWNLLTGVCGHTYGNHSIWSFTREATRYFPYTWRQVLRHPGAEQIGLIRKLRLAYDYFSFHGANEMLPTNYAGMGHMTAGRGDGYAFVYAPLGLPMTVRLDGFDGAKLLRAFFFDPRTGDKTL